MVSVRPASSTFRLWAACARRLSSARATTFRSAWPPCTGVSGRTTGTAAPGATVPMFSSTGSWPLACFRLGVNVARSSTFVAGPYPGCSA